jgi:hypothetical protein
MSRDFFVVLIILLVIVALVLVATNVQTLMPR